MELLVTQHNGSHIAFFHLTSYLNMKLTHVNLNHLRWIKMDDTSPLPMWNSKDRKAPSVGAAIFS